MRPRGWCRLALPLLVVAAHAPAGAQAADARPTWQAEAGVTHDDNVTRGRTDETARGDQSLDLRVSADWTVGLNPNTRLLLTASGGGAAFDRYSRLSRGFAEAEATLEYRASGGFSEPTYAAFVSGTADEYRSTLRSGSRHAVGVRVSVPLTDRVFAVASAGYERWHARSAVFSGSERSVRLNLDCAVSAAGTLYGAIDYRQGDAVGAGRESLENIDIARVFVADDAFADAGLLSYRFDARTVVAVLGFNQGVGRDWSVDLSWRRAETRPRGALPFAGGSPGRYVANQVVLALLKRF